MEKEEYIRKLKTANTKEELIILNFKIRRMFYSMKIFKKIYEDLDKKLASDKNIIEKIMLAYIKEEDIYKKVLEICEEENVIINNIESLLTDEINKDKNNSKYKIILNSLRYHLTKDIILEQEQRNNNINFDIAKTTVRLYLNSSFDTKEEFLKSTNCSNRWLMICVNILKVKSHPLYYEYLRKNKKIDESMTRKAREELRQQNELLELKMDNLSNNDILEILKLPSNSKEFTIFCKHNHFLPKLVKTLLKKNSNFKEELANDLNFYYVYEDEYKKLFISVIDEIRIAFATNNRIPFNLYEYYKKSDFTIEELRDSFYSAPDIENKGLLGKYISINTNIFKALDKKDIEVIKNMQILTCGNSTITYDRIILNKAFNDLEEKGIPLTKGTLYGAIKHQKELVKKK